MLKFLQEIFKRLNSQLSEHPQMQNDEFIKVLRDNSEMMLDRIAVIEAKADAEIARVGKWYRLAAFLLTAILTVAIASFAAVIGRNSHEIRNEARTYFSDARDQLKEAREQQKDLKERTNLEFASFTNRLSQELKPDRIQEIIRHAVTREVEALLATTNKENAIVQAIQERVFQIVHDQQQILFHQFDAIERESRDLLRRIENSGKTLPQQKDEGR